MSEDIYKEAIEKYGNLSQMDMVVEECSELIQAVQKFKRGEDNRSNVLEEIADVEIMCAQARLIFDFTGHEVDNVKAYKLERLKQRIKSD